MATDFLVKQGRVMGGVRLVTDADVAHQTDLTNIRETGTTSSQAISAGTYFYLNNVLVKAKVDIANGATFTLNTNYEVVTAGALNELNDAINRGSVSITADGTKTYSQLFNSLFALVNLSKVTNNSYLVFDYHNSSGTKAQYILQEIANNYLVFNRTAASSSGARIESYYIASTGSSNMQATGSTRVDISTQIPTSGWSFEIFY